jgi:hypothetical protein
MQRGRLDKHGTRCVPNLDDQHCFVSFIEEYWDLRNSVSYSTGRIEVFVKDEMYDVTELRWYFEVTPEREAAFANLRERYDFVNLNWKEYQTMKKQLEPFYDNT